MKTFFDDENRLNIDELVYNQPSFLKIIEDGIVTEAELDEQSRLVIGSLKQFQSSASEEQIDQVRNILAEISVLVAARQIYEKQAK